MGVVSNVTCGNSSWSFPDCIAYILYIILYGKGADRGWISVRYYKYYRSQIFPAREPTRACLLYGKEYLKDFGTSEALFLATMVTEQEPGKRDVSG